MKIHGTRREGTRLILGKQRISIVSLLALVMLIGAAILQPWGLRTAHASPSLALSTYNCTTYYAGNHHCYGKVDWPGTVPGSKTTMNLENLGCAWSSCYSTGWFVDNEMWLADFSSWAQSNCALGACWVEVGEGTFTSSPGTSDLYFWADSRPCGGGYAEHTGHLASSDVGYSTDLTINNSNRVTGSHSCPGSNGSWSVSASSQTYGTGVSGTSTANPMIPTDIQVGMEVFGNSGQSAPTANFLYNQWANTSDVFVYQSNPGYVTSEAPANGNWYIVPVAGGGGYAGTGGAFQTSCGC